MLLTHGLSADAIIIISGDNSTRTNWSGPERNKQQQYKNISYVTKK